MTKAPCAEAAYVNSRAVPPSLPEGVPYMFHGWVDAQGSGIPADYCHYVMDPGGTCVARDQASSMTSFSYVAHATNAASLVWSHTLQILLYHAGPCLPALSPPLKTLSLRRRDIIQRASVGWMYQRYLLGLQAIHQVWKPTIEPVCFGSMRTRVHPVTRHASIWFFRKTASLCHSHSQLSSAPIYSKLRPD
jgi:hypothetical protein